MVLFRDRLLFLPGFIVGPLFTISWLIEGSLRPDYSHLRHPVSSLSIGSRGWVQELTFVLTGLLLSAFFFLGIPLAAFTFARWFDRYDGSRWALCSRILGWSFLAGFVVTTIAFLQVGPLENVAGLFQRITITIGWAWVTLVAFHLLRGLELSEEYDGKVKDGAA